MRLCFEHTVSQTVDVLARFHENPENMRVLHEGWSRFRLIAHAGGVEKGRRTWFEITVAGILPVAMGFHHTTYEPYFRYGEEMIHGPFRSFTHFHEFEESPEGTLVRDVLEFTLPWYYGGETAGRLILTPLLRQTFLNRQQALSRHFNSVGR